MEKLRQNAVSHYAPRHRAALRDLGSVQRVTDMTEKCAQSRGHTESTLRKVIALCEDLLQTLLPASET